MAARPKPALVVHADWSVDAAKRWMVAARLVGGRYIVGVPRPVGDTATLLDRLSAEAKGGRVFFGFDFPLGLPRAYAAKAGIEHMLEWLPRAGSGAWKRFYDVAARPGEIALARPFYPNRSAGDPRPALAHLIARLGLSGREEILRHCDRGPPAAAPIFWTVGGNQVGKAALAGWRAVIAPALRDRREDLGVWPFDGALGELLSTRRVVLAETYPGEIYGHLGLVFARHAAGGGKRTQRGRRGVAGALLGWVLRAGVRLDPELAHAIADGFGPAPAGEDPFDATVGVLGMLNVVLGLRASGEPDAPAIRTVEGWILGRDAGKGLGIGRAPRGASGFSLHPQLAADTHEVARLDLCRVLLAKDSSFPWLILVPERAGVREVHELGAADRARLLAEIARATETLGALFAPDKLNLAALGNAVPQLHVHCIARYRTDRAWPRPIWGTGPAAPYAPVRLAEILARLRAAFSPASRPGASAMRSSRAAKGVRT